MSVYVHYGGDVDNQRNYVFVWGGAYRKYLSLNFTVNLTLFLKK